MKQSAWGFLSLVAVAFSVAAQAPLLPDASIVQSASQQIRLAIDRGDNAAMVEASLALNEQVVRMQDLDSRILVALQLQSEVSAVIGRTESDAGALQHMLELDAQAVAIDRSRNTSAWTLSEAIARFMTLSGDAAGAGDYLRQVIAREEPLVGPEHPRVRSARMQLVQATSALGEHREALELLEQTLASTVATYGEGTAESAEVLLTMAQIHLAAQEYREAATRADQAAAIVRENLTRLSQYSQPLGLVYVATARLDDAREMFQLMESLLVDAMPNVVDLRLTLYRNLAVVNARLGDGAAARRYLAAINDLAETVMQESPATRLGVLQLESELYNHAGLFDLAQESIARGEAFAASEGLAARPEVRLQLANSYLFAHDFGRARDYAAAVVEDVDPESPTYAAAGGILVIASALSEPAESRLELARELLAIAERKQPGFKHLQEQYQVAMSLAAAGNWEESERLQKNIIDTETADAGYYLTNNLQWETYAEALREIGRESEAGRIDALLERQRSPLREAFTDLTPREILVEQRSGFGFEVSLEDAGWSRNRGTTLGVPMAAFAASYGTRGRPNSSSIAIIPVLLPEGVPSATVIDAYLPTIYTNRSELEEWTNGVQSGYQARSIDSHFATGLPVVHASRVIVEPGAVYIYLTSAPASDAEAVAAAEGVFDRIVINPGATVDDLSPPERLLHADVLNYTGNMLFTIGRYEDARRFFGQSLEYGNKSVHSLNFTYSNYVLGDLEALIPAVDSHFEKFGEDPNFLLWRADLYGGDGQFEEAIADYERAFDGGAVDDGHAGVYMDLLIELDRVDAAAAFLDEYALSNESIEVQQLQAALGFAIGDDVRLERALAVLTDPGRSNSEAAAMAMSIVAERAEPAEVESLLQELIGKELESPELFMVVANFQARRGLVDAARSTLAQALELYPDDPDLKFMAENLPERRVPDI